MYTLFIHNGGIVFIWFIIFFLIVDFKVSDRITQACFFFCFNSSSHGYDLVLHKKKTAFTM